MPKAFGIDENLDNEQMRMGYLASEAARRYLPPELIGPFVRLMKEESSLRSGRGKPGGIRGEVTRSGERAQGPAQFTKIAIADLRQNGYPDFSPDNPVEAYDAAAFFVSMLLERHGDPTAAFLAYEGLPTPANQAKVARIFKSSARQLFPQGAPPRAKAEKQLFQPTTAQPQGRASMAGGKRGVQPGLGSRPLKDIPKVESPDKLSQFLQQQPTPLRSIGAAMFPPGTELGDVARGLPRDPSAPRGFFTDPSVLEPGGRVRALDREKQLGEKVTGGGKDTSVVGQQRQAAIGEVAGQVEGQELMDVAMAQQMANLGITQPGGGLAGGGGAGALAGGLFGGMQLHPEFAKRMPEPSQTAFELPEFEGPAALEQPDRLAQLEQQVAEFTSREAPQEAPISPALAFLAGVQSALAPQQFAQTTLPQLESIRQAPIRQFQREQELAGRQLTAQGALTKAQLAQDEKAQAQFDTQQTFSLIANSAPELLDAAAGFAQALAGSTDPTDQLRGRMLIKNAMFIGNLLQQVDEEGVESVTPKTLEVLQDEVDSIREIMTGGIEAAEETFRLRLRLDAQERLKTLEGVRKTPFANLSEGDKELFGLAASILPAVDEALRIMDETEGGLFGAPGGPSASRLLGQFGPGAQERIDFGTLLDYIKGAFLGLRGGKALTEQEIDTFRNSVPFMTDTDKKKRSNFEFIRATLPRLLSARLKASGMSDEEANYFLYGQTTGLGFQSRSPKMDDDELLSQMPPGTIKLGDSP